MDPTERIGLTVSAAGHGGLILLALIGGIFGHEDVSQPVATTEVSLISSSEFAALQAAAPRAPTESPVAPAEPSAPAEVEAPAPVEAAAPETAAPAPDAPPEADPAPDVTDIEAPPVPDASETEPTLDTPPVETPSETVLETIAPRPRPTDAPRVAPTPAETPEPDAAPADQVVAETAPTPDDTALPEPEVEAAAPEAATTQTPVEDETAEVTESSAPVTSPRPRSRPERPAPAETAEAPTEVAAAEPTPAAAPDAVAETDVADALAEALSGEASEEPQAGTGIAESGPPMTSGEKDALVVAVKQCWNVGALSTDALNTTVVIAVTMGQDGMPDTGSIRMLSAEGGDDTAARQAFETGRRAIIRCARNGYPLPPEKYAQWRNLEIEFNPNKMRMR